MAEDAQPIVFDYAGGTWVLTLGKPNPPSPALHATAAELRAAGYVPATELTEAQAKYEQVLRDIRSAARGEHIAMDYDSGAVLLVAALASDRAARARKWTALREWLSMKIQDPRILADGRAALEGALRKLNELKQDSVAPASKAPEKPEAPPGPKPETSAAPRRESAAAGDGDTVMTVGMLYAAVVAAEKLRDNGGTSLQRLSFALVRLMTTAPLPQTKE